MPDITANAPDGTQHVFPDGTDPTVVDRVMKQYITKGNAPSGPQQDQSQIGNYQNRPGGPILNANNSPLREAALASERAFGIHNPSSVADALRQTLTALGGAAKQSYKSLGGGSDSATSMVADPFK